MHAKACCPAVRCCDAAHQPQWLLTHDVDCAQATVSKHLTSGHEQLACAWVLSQVCAAPWLSVKIRWCQKIAGAAHGTCQAAQKPLYVRLDHIDELCQPKEAQQVQHAEVEDDLHLHPLWRLSACQDDCLTAAYTCFPGYMANPLELGLVAAREETHACCTAHYCAQAS